MAGDWLSIVRSKGGKASAPNQTESHVEQVVMDNESEGVYVRAVMRNVPRLAGENLPTHLSCTLYLSVQDRCRTGPGSSGPQD